MGRFCPEGEETARMPGLGSADISYDRGNGSDGELSIEYSRPVEKGKVL